ncbi:MAG: hypothetical protein Q8O31_04965 [Rhodocyclaceae bacterium]|nr:hypothetical protein [Rhodocyclaceae bacterium]
MTLDTPPQDAPPPPVHAPVPVVDPRNRLRELLRVSERDRSDAQWDEINELEIQMAPGNRLSPNSPHGSPHGGDRPPSSSKRPQRSRGGGDRGGSGGSTSGGGGGGGDRRPPRKPRPPQQPV